MAVTALDLAVRQRLHLDYMASFRPEHTGRSPFDQDYGWPNTTPLFAVALSPSAAF